MRRDRHGPPQFHITQQLFGESGVAHGGSRLRRIDHAPVNSLHYFRIGFFEPSRGEREDFAGPHTDEQSEFRDQLLAEVEHREAGLYIVDCHDALERACRFERREEEEGRVARNLPFGKRHVEDSFQIPPKMIDG